MTGDYVVYKYGFTGKLEESAIFKSWKEIVKYIKPSKKSNKHFEIYQDGYFLLSVKGKIENNS